MIKGLLSLKSDEGPRVIRPPTSDEELAAIRERNLERARQLAISMGNSYALSPVNRVRRGDPDNLADVIPSLQRILK